MYKSMPLAELVMFKKIMGMTFSDQDGEALNAIRKANAMLAKHKLDWYDVLGRAVNGAADGPTMTARQAPPHAQPGPQTAEAPKAQPNKLPIEEQIRRAFDELRGNLHGSFETFINSLETQFLDKGDLSIDQRRALFKAVTNQRSWRKRDE